MNDIGRRIFTVLLITAAAFVASYLGYHDGLGDSRLAYKYGYIDGMALASDYYGDESMTYYEAAARVKKETSECNVKNR